MSEFQTTAGNWRCQSCGALIAEGYTHICVIPPALNPPPDYAQYQNRIRELETANAMQAERIADLESSSRAQAYTIGDLQDEKNTLAAQIVTARDECKAADERIRKLENKNSILRSVMQKERFRVIGILRKYEHWDDGHPFLDYDEAMAEALREVQEVELPTTVLDIEKELTSLQTIVAAAQEWNTANNTPARDGLLETELNRQKEIANTASKLSQALAAWKEASPRSGVA